MTNGDTSVYFVDGYSPRKGLLGILAYPNYLKGQDVEFTRFYTTLDGQWWQLKYDFDSRSLVYLKKDDYRAWWILGKRGEVVEIKGGVSSHEKILDAGTGKGKLGYLNKLAVIDGELYACGYQRQVYCRRNGAWDHIDGGMIPKNHSMGTGFESMDGTSKDNIYAVGNHGEIWYYNGKSWQQCESPTNVHLNEVKCVTPDEVYVCGQHGIVLKGSKNHWDVIQNERFSDDLWGIEAFQHEIYIAGFSGLGVIKNNEIAPLDLGLGKNIAGYRLRGCDGLLWSIGNDHIVYFDGKKWTEIICPDNN